MSVADDVKLAVERAVTGPVTFLERVPVIETFRGQIVWEGAVDIFSVNTPPPNRAYGWAVESDSGPQYVAVMGTPPIDSPLAAVRAWLVSKSK